MELLVCLGLSPELCLHRETQQRSVWVIKLKGVCQKGWRDFPMRSGNFSGS